MTELTDLYEKTGIRKSVYEFGEEIHRIRCGRQRVVSR